MKRIPLAFLGAATLLFGPALAAGAHHAKPEAAVIAQTSAMTEGEVRNVDKVTKKITLKHGPIVNLDMPGMTMVFRVADPALLDQVKAGDKVKFLAEKVGKDFTVTKLDRLK